MEIAVVEAIMSKNKPITIRSTKYTQILSEELSEFISKNEV